MNETWIKKYTEVATVFNQAEGKRFTDIKLKFCPLELQFKRSDNFITV